MKEEHTIALLKECSSGCKMALNSMGQILEYVQDEMLEHTILEAKEEHEKLEKKSGGLLRKQGEHEKQPSITAEAFAKITTDVKMMMNGGNCQIYNSRRRKLREKGALCQTGALFCVAVNVRQAGVCHFIYFH